MVYCIIILLHWPHISGFIPVLAIRPVFSCYFMSDVCYEIQYMWTARSTETETETGLDRYVMLGARWLTEY